MFESEFEKRIREDYEIWDNYEPEKFVEAIHPYFPNRVDAEWAYPPKPTVQAMYLFGRLKKELSNHIIGFEMALEVCLKTGDDSVVFIDIAIWYKNKKYAIEVNGDSKKSEVIDKKNKSLQPYNWIVFNVWNSEIEDDEFTELVIKSLAKAIINSGQEDIEDVV
ncbi:hypothetical protein [Priestia megaterium]|uniref:hypothetical protein n=1 Tax=Priestia megaterium TaxID=1404 RepID=UPI0028776AF6|nr:hypothetical protein [Priestia megaterium]